jgi:hypothetical protein
MIKTDKYFYLFVYLFIYWISYVSNTRGGKRKRKKSLEGYQGGS